MQGITSDGKNDDALEERAPFLNALGAVGFVAVVARLLVQEGLVRSPQHVGVVEQTNLLNGGIEQCFDLRFTIRVFEYFFTRLKQFRSGFVV